MDEAGFDIGVRDSWKAALESVEAAGGTAVPHPRRRLRPPARRPRLRELGPEVASQEASSACSSTRSIVCTVTGSTHAGMIAGSALEGRGDRRVSASTRRRRWTRRVDQVTRIATPPPTPSASTGICATTRSPGRRLRRPDLWRPRRTDDRGDPARRADRGHAHRPGVRGQVDGRADRHDPLGEIPAGSRVLYAHLGGQPALSAYAHTGLAWRSRIAVIRRRSAPRCTVPAPIVPA